MTTVGAMSAADEPTGATGTTGTDEHAGAAEAGEVVEVVAAAMVAGGDALSRLDGGEVVLVEGALPGERVRVELAPKRKGVRRGITVDVVDPSPARVAPPCATLDAGCGGCAWQHVARDAQPGLKVDIVRDALRRIAHLPDVAVTVAAPVDAPAGRTSMRLGVDGDGRLALHRRASSGIVAITEDGCGAAHPLLDDVIRHGRFPGATEVVLRAGVATDERLAVVRGGPGAAADARVPEGVVVIDAGDEGARRAAAIHEVVAERLWRVSADSFFQSGPAAAEGIVAAVARAAGEAVASAEVVVDAYAGVGLIGGALVDAAGGGAHLVAVEQHPAAVRDARRNLVDLGADVVRVEVARWKPAAAVRRADVVVADPGRPGLGRGAVARLVALRPTTFVLVSCDPASLARDATLLRDAGYVLAGVEVVDAFPDTFHVEAVSTFRYSSRLGDD